MRHVDKNETAWVALVVLGMLVAVSTSGYLPYFQLIQNQEQVSHAE
jgi:hypothetical protein